MDSMLYASTNRQAPAVKLAEALLRGQAPDKGLYLPVEIPRFAPGELASLYDKSYPEIAAAVLEKFTAGTFATNELLEMCRSAYVFDVPLERVDAQRHVMRLDRGPTASFKDFAGLMMGRMFGTLRRNAAGGRLVILTATSGDTGSAIANAFYKIPNVEVMILFPPAEVSARQRKQMTTLGENITAVGVEGKFDDCQALVKQAFADETLRGIELTSANSINIGRLLPQIVYYVYAAARLTKGEKPIVFSVPSGNFGNMMGALLASRMGLPLEKLVVATNENDEVPRFMETAEYHKIVPSLACLSNAMNVGHPSNFARVIALFDGWLDETGVMRRKPDMERMSRELWATGVTDAETRETIQKTWREHQLLLEPHGAVGWLGLERYLRETSSTATAVSVETAHPAKFPEEIEKLLGFSPEVPPSLAALGTKSEHYLTMPGDYGAFHKLLLDTYK
ncbi:MAG: threonine synthase [Acidobacteriota bacterium]|jgi:threonine synthase|nr:threonine synthase [Acidobacteriota bacterium]